MTTSNGKKSMAWDIEESIYIELLGEHPQRGDMRQLIGNIFHMFSAFIGETKDFGEGIKKEFPKEWKLVNTMEVKKK